MTEQKTTQISDVLEQLDEKKIETFETFEVLDIQTTEDLTTLLKSNRINFVDCYADWCGPCKKIYPSYKKMSEDLASNEKVRFFKLNIDNKEDAIQEFVSNNNITFIPFFIMVENGEATQSFANFGELQQYIQKTF